MKTLAARKQLLVMESELHRAQLGHELESLQSAAQGMVRQARHANAVVSQAAQTWTNVRASLAGKCSWLTTLLRGFRLFR